MNAERAPSTHRPAATPHTSWFKKLSIKLRVSICTSLFAMLVVGLAVAIILYAANALYIDTARTRMEDMARDASDDAEFATATRLRIDDDMLYYDDGVSIVLLDPDDATLLSGFYPLTFPRAAGISLAGHRTLTDAQRGRWLMLDVLSDEGFVVRAVYSLHEIETNMRTLVITAVAASTLLTLLIALGNYYIAYLAFRPVAKINALANTISSGSDLRARIPLPAAHDEIYALAEEFNGMFQRLTLAFDKERQFTQDASHELRTPVAVILAECELYESDPDAHNESIADIRAQATHMSRLVQQLLMLARAGNGTYRLELERMDVCDIAALVCASLSEQAETRHVRVTCECGARELVGYADQTLITRLLVNLVSNAIAYSDGDKCESYVRVDCVTDESCGAVITVSDNGIGISEADQARIFDRFYRADAARLSSSAEGNTGLGLSLCKWIVEAHNGEISVCSTPGEGSVFTAHIPNFRDS